MIVPNFLLWLGLMLADGGGAFRIGGRLPSVSSTFCFNGVSSSSSMAPRSSFCTRTTTTCLWMGKGDGKNKKPKKKKKKHPTTATPEAATPQPCRVSNQINIPVRQQIAWAQHRKQQQASSTTRFRQRPRTKYRRTEEDVQLRLAARPDRDADWNVVLNSTIAAPLVLVDGYNIVFAWPRLKKHMVKGDVARARQLLLDDLEGLRSLKGWRMECVFDGNRQRSPLGDTRTPQQQQQPVDTTVSTSIISKHGVRVVFTRPGVEADAYIERRCAAAKNVTDGKLTGSLIVATDDAMIRLAGQSAGALCMGAERFVTELKAMRRGTADRVEAAVARANGHEFRPKELRGRDGIFGTPENNFVVRDLAAERKQRKEARRLEREMMMSMSSNLTRSTTDNDSGIPYWAKMPNRTNWQEK